MSYLTSYDEKALLLQIASGDEGAFSRLFRLYHQLLGTYILRLTKSRELTEDIVQDVFMKIWLNRQDLVDVRDFRAFLFVASKNHALNCLKKKAKEQSVVTGLDENVDVPMLADTILEDEYYLLIDEAIDQLSPQQQKVFLMSRHERLKYTEIAQQLNLSRETVKKYLQLSTESITFYIRNKLITKAIVLLFYFF